MQLGPLLHTRYVGVLEYPRLVCWDTIWCAQMLQLSQSCHFGGLRALAICPEELRNKAIHGSAGQDRQD